MIIIRFIYKKKHNYIGPVFSINASGLTTIPNSLTVNGTITNSGLSTINTNVNTALTNVNNALTTANNAATNANNALSAAQNLSNNLKHYIFNTIYKMAVQPDTTNLGH